MDRVVDLDKALPHELGNRLLKFQREGVTFALKCGGRCMIADEMGLGKTVQAIATAWVLRQQWPLLIVVPSSMRFSWADELEKWLPAIQPSDISILRNGKELHLIGSGKITIVTYGLLIQKNVVESIKTANFRMVIADESHYLKNSKSKRTLALLPILKRAEHVILLTGTPALARPEELYSQLVALQSKEWGSFNNFAKRYCGAFFDKRLRIWNTSGASNLDELNQRLRKVMIRRLKMKVLTQLPEKRRQRVHFELPESQIKELKAQLKDLYKLCRDIPEGKSPWECKGEVNSMVTKLYNQSGMAKIPATRKFVVDMIRGGAKFLVFAHHLDVISSIEGCVAAEKVRYIKITGETPPHERHRQVKMFQADDSVRVAVLSMTAAGQGITLTAATSVVFAELHWTPGVLQQAEDRAHRIGQKNAINVQYLVAKNTLDEMLWRMLSRKVSVISQTLDGERTTLKAGNVKDTENSCSQSVFSEWVRETLSDELNDTQDIRSFFNPKGRFFVKRKRNSSSPGAGKKMSDSKWSCPRCTLLNVANRISCAACGNRREECTSSSKSKSEGDVLQNEEGLSTPSSKKKKMRRKITNPTFKFSVSRNTGRVYLYTLDDKPMNLNFTIADLESSHFEKLPQFLANSPCNISEARRFVKLWSELRGVEKNLLYNTPCHTPRIDAQRLKMKRKLDKSTTPNGPSTIRFTPRESFEMKSSSKGSFSKQVVCRPGNHAKFTYTQHFSEDGRPICLYCANPFYRKGATLENVMIEQIPGNTARKRKSSVDVIDNRFCSAKCAKEYQVRVCGNTVRRQLFELEHGQCQLCNLDCHVLYQRLKVLMPSQRRKEIEQSPFKYLSWKQKENIVRDPQEGQLWQADHIHAVAEGGGECGIENYRTLCTPCHKKETSKLKHRLKLSSGSTGSSDIRSFFGKKREGSDNSTAVVAPPRAAVKPSSNKVVKVGQLSCKDVSDGTNKGHNSSSKIIDLT